LPSAFIRDVISDQIVVSPTHDDAACALLRPNEHAADIAEIARLEVDFICTELVRFRSDVPTRAHNIRVAATLVPSPRARGMTPPKDPRVAVRRSSPTAC
jgi:hypothetical protein